MRVMIALDGTPVGERAARAVATWANETGAEIHLLSVLHSGDSKETVANPGFVHSATPAGTMTGQSLNVREPFPHQAESRSQALTRAHEERMDYLRLVVAKWFPALAIKIHVADAETATAIVEHAERLGVDFIAMGTRGHHGVGQALFGSLHEEVVKRAHMPVLLIGPEAALATG